VHIEQSPFKVPDAFKAAGGEWPQRAQNAQAALVALGDDAPTRNYWAQVARDNAAVETTLVGLGEDKSARLMNHAYVLTMVNAHVILDFPLLAVPPQGRFVDLLDY
jgi:hypothetical protein